MEVYTYRINHWAAMTQAKLQGGPVCPTYFFNFPVSSNLTCQCMEKLCILIKWLIVIKVKYVQKSFHKSCGKKMCMLSGLIQSSTDSLSELQHSYPYAHNREVK